MQLLLLILIIAPAPDSKTEYAEVVDDVKESVIHWQDGDGNEGSLDLLNQEQDDPQWYGYEQYENYDDGALVEMPDKEYYDFLMELYKEQKENPANYKRIERGKRAIRDEVFGNSAQGHHRKLLQEYHAGSSKKSGRGHGSKRAGLLPYPGFSADVKWDVVKQRRSPPDAGPDGGPPDSSTRDAGPPDTGLPPDAGPREVSQPDAGPPDETEIPEKPEKKAKSKPVENSGKIRVLKPAPTIKPQLTCLRTDYDLCNVYFTIPLLVVIFLVLLCFYCNVFIFQDPCKCCCKVFCCFCRIFNCCTPKSLNRGHYLPCLTVREDEVTTYEKLSQNDQDLLKKFNYK